MWNASSYGTWRYRLWNKWNKTWGGNTRQDALENTRKQQREIAHIITMSHAAAHSLWHTFRFEFWNFVKFCQGIQRKNTPRMPWSGFRMHKVPGAGRCSIHYSSLTEGRYTKHKLNSYQNSSKKNELNNIDARSLCTSRCTYKAKPKYQLCCSNCIWNASWHVPLTVIIMVCHRIHCLTNTFQDVYAMEYAFLAAYFSFRPSIPCRQFNHVIWRLYYKSDRVFQKFF